LAVLAVSPGRAFNFSCGWRAAANERGMAVGCAIHVNEGPAKSPKEASGSFAAVQRSRGQNTISLTGTADVKRSRCVCRNWADSAPCLIVFPSDPAGSGAAGVDKAMLEVRPGPRRDA
jgi:hypothetical protein